MSWDIIFGLVFNLVLGLFRENFAYFRTGNNARELKVCNVRNKRTVKNVVAGTVRRDAKWVKNGLK
jgi:hypothetical protein